jgi:hypothetical protein
MSVSRTHLSFFRYSFLKRRTANAAEKAPPRPNSDGQVGVFFSCRHFFVWHRRRDGTNNGQREKGASSALPTVNILADKKESSQPMRNEKRLHYFYIVKNSII